MEKVHLKVAVKMVLLLLKLALFECSKNNARPKKNSQVINNSTL